MKETFPLLCLIVGERKQKPTKKTHIFLSLKNTQFARRFYDFGLRSLAIIASGSSINDVTVWRGENLRRKPANS